MGFAVGHRLGLRRFAAPATGLAVVRGQYIDKSNLGMTSTEVDDYLNELVSGDVKYYHCVINLLGNSSNTSASAAAIETLTNSPYNNHIQITS